MTLQKLSPFHIANMCCHDRLRQNCSICTPPMRSFNLPIYETHIHRPILNFRAKKYVSDNNLIPEGCFLHPYPKPPNRKRTPLPDIYSQGGLYGRLEYCEETRESEKVGIMKPFRPFISSDALSIENIVMVYIGFISLGKERKMTIEAWKLFLEPDAWRKMFGK